MLERSGDLIPVKDAAVNIPWTKRKNQILDFLLRGPVDFDTFVYDTNVGDVSRLSTYFNPARWSVEDLNGNFAKGPDQAKGQGRGQAGALVPNLIVYPEVVKVNDEDVRDDESASDRHTGGFNEVPVASSDVNGIHNDFFGVENAFATDEFRFKDEGVKENVAPMGNKFPLPQSRRQEREEERRVPLQPIAPPKRHKSSTSPLTPLPSPEQILIGNLCRSPNEETFAKVLNDGDKLFAAFSSSSTSMSPWKSRKTPKSAATTLQTPKTNFSAYGLENLLSNSSNLF